MNENIDLTKILKNCPKGWNLYSSVYGDVTFYEIKDNSNYPIRFLFVDKNGNLRECDGVTEKGLFATCYKGECIIFPSKDQRDWSKFTAPWYKKESKRFDPKTLAPFDKVLVRDECYERWKCDFYSYFHNDNGGYPYIVIKEAYKQCIPYNDKTKYLIGTNEEAPEYYRYWED